MTSPIKAHGPNLICEKLNEELQRTTGGIHMPTDTEHAMAKFRILSVGNGIPTDTPPNFRVPLQFEVGQVICALRSAAILIGGRTVWLITEGAVIGTITEEPLVQGVTIANLASALAH